MNPAPYMTLLASGGSTSAGIRCSEKIIVKLLKNANINTWKKFMITKSWKSRFVRICHVWVLNMAKDTAGWCELCSTEPAASGSQSSLSKRLLLWTPV